MGNFNCRQCGIIIVVAQTTTLGGSAISFPAFVQGDMVRIGLEEAPPLILTDVTKGEKEP
jgi:hypothetical protein